MIGLTSPVVCDLVYKYVIGLVTIGNVGTQKLPTLMCHNFIFHYCLAIKVTELTKHLVGVKMQVTE